MSNNAGYATKIKLLSAPCCGQIGVSLSGQY